MAARKSTVAVVPAYNSADLVADRVAELRTSSFSTIVVCDDGSSDESANRLEALAQDRVVPILGDHNVGPAGNRNRVLGFLEHAVSDYLFFSDADCRVTYRGNLGNIIDAGFEAPEVGVIGFGILDPDGSPMKWNYGTLMHPLQEAADQRLEELLGRKLIAKEQFVIGAPSRAASYRMVTEKGPKEVGWVAEGCFAIRTELFKELGGFDTDMRFHEAHDLNARAQMLGYKTVFNPVAFVQHLQFDSRFERRVEDEIAAKLHYFQKHWAMSEEVFRRLYDLG